MSAPDDSGRAAAILALPEAKQHPAAAAKLAADPACSVSAARAVLATIPVAIAREANAAAYPFIQQMLAARSAVDGQVHMAVERGVDLSRHNDWNARMARIERDGLSDDDRAETARAWESMRRKRAAA